jgi:hypothetical protein
MPFWLRGPVLGALLGLPILGGGGRLAMHAVALTLGAQRSVTVEGTLTVLLSGMAAGVAGGAIYELLARALPARRLLRAALFGVVLTLLTLRGLNPVQPLTLALFLPVVIVYGWVLERTWHKRSRSTHALHASP